MNVEFYALSKNTGYSIEELEKMETNTYYELYLTHKKYNAMIQQQIDKQNK